MDKPFALFPNLTAVASEEFFGIMLSPCSGSRGVLAFSTASPEERIRRKVEVVSSCLVWAAYQAGLDIRCGDYTTLCNELPLTQVGTVDLGTLLPFIPDLKKAMPTVFWFTRFLRADNEQSRIISIYNALGTLDEGFDGISLFFEMMGKDALGTLFLQTVEDHRAEEDDKGSPPIPRSLTKQELEQVQDVYMTNAKRFLGIANILEKADSLK